MTKNVVIGIIRVKSNILPLPKLFKFEVAKIVDFYKFNLLPKIFDNYELNPAILVPQDFHLIIILPFLCLKVIELNI